jgi:hypothetical protein
VAWCAVALMAPAAARGAGGPVGPVQGGAGIQAPGGEVSYVAVAAGRDTLIERIRRGTGAVERSRLLHGSWGIPGVGYDGTTTGLSADGFRLVVAHNFTRARTMLAVLDTDRLAVRDRITVPGFATVDAVSPTARWMYLIAYRRDQTHYAVRAYDIGAHRMLPRPVIDPTEPDEKMEGIPVTRVMSGDGRWAYTLYQRGDEAPFIHALDTADRTARCIDLPQITAGDIFNLRLQMRGRELQVVYLAREAQVVMDTRTFRVTGPPFPQPRPAPARPEGGGGGTTWPEVALFAVILAALAQIARRRRHPRSAPA